MNCRLVRRHLDAFVDSELDPSSQLEFERHVSVCAGCQEHAAVLVSLKQATRDAYEDADMPEHLVARVADALAQADQGRSAASPLVRVVPLKMRHAVPMAAAAAALLVFGWVGNPGPTGTEDGQPTVAASLGGGLFEDVVNLHSKQLPADVSGERGNEAVVSYFRDKLAFPVAPPAFQGLTARLIGARLSNVRERQAAAFYYDVGGHRVTLVVFRKPPNFPNGIQRAHMFGKTVHYTEIGGYTVPVRQRNGLTYALTGDLDRNTLLRLAARVQDARRVE